MPGALARTPRASRGSPACSRACAACPRPRAGSPPARRRTRARRSACARAASAAAWRATKPRMPSMKDSSLPVESRITRTPSGGSSRSSRASSSRTATAARLSLAPGTTERVAMSPTASVEPSADQAAQRGAGRAGRAARRARRARARRPRAASAAARSPGGRTSRGTCRRPSGSGPGGRSARRARRRGGRRRRPSRRRPGRRPPRRRWTCARRGSRRRKRCGPAGDVVGDPGRRGQPGDRGERPRARRQSPAAAPAARHQRDRDGERAGGPLLLDPGLEPELGASRVADPLRRARAPRPRRTAGRSPGGARRSRAGGCGSRRHRAAARLVRCAPCKTPIACSARSSPARSPPRVVREDERTVAFMDINPATRGHLLVIPREHVARPARDRAPRTWPPARRPRRSWPARSRERLGADGVNLMNSCGRDAWQTVFHFHLHVIPRYAGDPLRLPWTPAPGDRDEIAAAAAELTRG